ncbi:MAG: hypothetical protein B7Z74_04450 [Deltaproteobacteria bacterium 21-66-5]|nr:MAG: hypothetical protein B7Z74_04450 [Deltaproteobacteria bacterium 21-66-5]
MAVGQLQGILQKHFAETKKKCGLPVWVHAAAEAIMGCRTAAMGGHVEKCPDGHVERVWYNSCKHRSCPRCGHLPTARWLEKQRARILACDHHHVVFTLPPELHALWRYNRELMIDLLFRCVRDTLFTLLGDENYGGLVPGLLCSLHTWGRSLCFHPHLHCLLTAWGLNTQGVWVKAKKANLLPFMVVRELYRGKMIASIRSELQAGTLTLPPGLPAFRLEHTLNQLGRKSWNVDIREQYRHGEGVLIYLARYVRGGPISESRIVSTEGSSVTFRYLDHRDKTMKAMTLTAQNFLLRVLQHVPPPRKKTVRYYGLYAEHNAQMLDACREALGQESATPTGFLRWEAYWTKTEKELPNLCPVCRKALVPVQRLRRWSTYHPGLKKDHEHAA